MFFKNEKSPFKRIFFQIFNYNKIQSDDGHYNKYWEYIDQQNELGNLNNFKKERTDWILDKIVDDAVVLDIGAGDGSILLYIMKKKKIKPVAIEISDYLIKHLKKNKIKTYNLNISDLDSLKKLPQCDHIILFEIIEHLQNPEKLIQSLESKVRKSFFISIPNSGYFVYRLRLLFGRVPMQWVIHPGEHVRFWTYTDIKWWLKELGYYKKSTIKLYQGVPILNKLWGSLWAKGIVIEIKN